MTSSDEKQNFGIVLIYCDNHPTTAGSTKLKEDALHYYDQVMKFEGFDISERGGGNDYDSLATHMTCATYEQEHEHYTRLRRFFERIDGMDDQGTWLVFRISEFKDILELRRFTEARKFDPVKNPPCTLEVQFVFDMKLKEHLEKASQSIPQAPPLDEEETPLPPPLDLSAPIAVRPLGFYSDLHPAEEDEPISPRDLCVGEDETSVEDESSS